jgi:hypothetical protein
MSRCRELLLVLVSRTLASVPLRALAQNEPVIVEAQAATRDRTTVRQDSWR